MDLRTVTQFLAVMEHGTLGRAAEALHVTQPTLSKSIQRLEHSLRVRLFERSHQGLEPTAYAVALAPYAREMASRGESMRELMDMLRSGQAGSVTMGAGPSIAANLMPAVVAKLAVQVPGVRVWMVEGVVAQLLPLLQAGQLDFFVGTAMLGPLDPGISHRMLRKDRIAIVASVSHPIHRRRGLTLEALLDQPWVLAPDEHYLTQGCYRLFGNAGLPAPVASVVTTSFGCIERLLAQGRHLSAMPVSYSHSPTRRYRSVVLEGGDWERDVWLYQRRSDFVAPCVATAIAAVEVECDALSPDMVRKRTPVE